MDFLEFLGRVFGRGGMSQRVIVEGALDTGATADEACGRLSRPDRRRLEKAEDVFRGLDERAKIRLRAVIDVLE